jgi:hypothetical protein
MKIRRHKSAALVLILSLLLLTATKVFANDSGAEMGASGLQLKKIYNISMDREDLSISEKKIKVTYLFNNHSDKDITTEIAFPVPEYTAEDAQRGLPFDDFEVKVNGDKFQYKSEIKALLRGKDYSATLIKMGISIHDFGGFSEPKYRNFYQDLSEKNKKVLRKKGLVDEDGYPLWRVSIKYHWTQTFPANSTTEIKHTYTPWWGYTMVDHYLIDDRSSYLYKDACISEETKQWMKQTLTNIRPVSVAIVSYILKTANNWRTPIKEFNLTIEKNAHAKLGLCFDYRAIHKSDTEYEIQIKNFIPKQNLKVYYFQ